MLRARTPCRANAAATALIGGFLLLSCGGGSSPGGPSTPPPAPTYSVTATVFYDENGNGFLDTSEIVRVPNVTVTIGTGTGTSAPTTGQAAVTGIQEGSFAPQVRTESLPAYFEPPIAPLAPVTVPGGATEIRIPLTLPVGGNRKNRYFGYGDSITAGDGSADGQGYALKLQTLLAPHFGYAEVVKFGRSGTNSAQGLERIRTWLRTYSPSYVMILYGTNDWQDQTCQNKGPAACFTIDSLDGMIDAARNYDVLPVLATIIPVNPAKAPPGRQQWIDEMNVQIKALAQRRAVDLADLNADMKAGSASLASLYFDDVHPNDAGYQVLAQGWFKAITRSRSAASSSRRFGFRLP